MPEKSGCFTVLSNTCLLDCFSEEFELRIHFQGKQLCHFHFCFIIHWGTTLKGKICSPKSKFFPSLFHYSLWGPLLKERICSLKSKFFPFLFHYSLWGPLLKERICSLKSKFFPLRVGPFWNTWTSSE